MIKSAKIRNATGVRRYLKDGVEADAPSGVRAEYYLGKTEHYFELSGSGWELSGFDLKRDLENKAFDNLLEGKGPNGETWVKSRSGVHVAGWDLQTSPPKSVSAAMVDGDDVLRDFITDAHHDANRTAMKYIDDNAKAAVIKRKGVKSMENGHLFIYTTTHHTARETAETRERGQKGGDPQMHSHNMVFNVQETDDGVKRAVEHRGIVHVQTAAEAIYILRLLDRFREEGIEVEHLVDRKGRRTFELKGSDARVRNFWSTRGKAVNKLIRDHERKYGRGPTTQENIDLARQDRGKHNHDEPSWAHYADVRDAAGLDPQVVVRGSQELPADGAAQLFDRLVASDGLCRNGRDFYRWEVRAHVLRHAAGLLSTDDAIAWAEDFMKSPELRMVKPSDKGDPAYDRLTTATLERRERWVADRAVAKHRTKHAAPSPIGIERQIRRAGVTVTNEQASAIRHLASDSGLAILGGKAGTGKTTVLKTVVKAYRHENLVDNVLSISTSRMTAIRTGDKIEADLSTSIEGLLKTSLEITEKTLVILDESVMLDTPRFYDLMRHCDKAIIRMIGDDHQLQAIGAGGLHVEIAERIGYSPLTEVFRQHDQWYVDVCDDIRNGEIAKALNSIADHDGWHESMTHAEAIGALVRKYVELRDAGLKGDDILITTDMPNAVIDTLNRLIQDARLQRRELTGAGLTVHDDFNNRTETYYRGDEYVFRETLGEGVNKVRNGTRGRISHVDTKRGEIVVQYGKCRHMIVPLDAVGKQPGHLAYAGHATLVQGHEGKAVLVLPGAYQTDRVSGYMMASRGREQVHIFASNEFHGENAKAGLSAMWAQFDPKRTVSREIDFEEIREQDFFDLQEQHDIADDFVFSTNADFVRTAPTERQRVPTMSRGLA